MNEHIKSVKVYFDDDLIRDKKICNYLNIEKSWLNWVDYRYAYREITSDIFYKLARFETNDLLVYRIIDLIKAYHNPAKFKKRKAGILFTLRKHSLHDINNRNWKWCSRWGIWDENWHPKEYAIKVSILRERYKHSDYGLIKCGDRSMLETMEVWIEIDEFLYDYLSKENTICEDNFIVEI